jgi:hypothetical protein
MCRRAGSIVPALSWYRARWASHRGVQHRTRKHPGGIPSSFQRSKIDQEGAGGPPYSCGFAFLPFRPPTKPSRASIARPVLLDSLNEVKRGLGAHDREGGVARCRSHGRWTVVDGINSSSVPPTSTKDTEKTHSCMGTAMGFVCDRIHSVRCGAGNHYFALHAATSGNAHSDSVKCGTRVAQSVNESSLDVI